MHQHREEDTDIHNSIRANIILDHDEHEQSLLQKSIQIPKLTQHTEG